MGTLDYNIAQLAKPSVLPLAVRAAAAEILRAAEAAGHHVAAVSWFNPASTPEHHVPGMAGNGGVAVDFMTYTDEATQDWIDQYMWGNRTRLGLCWQISRRRIRSTSKGRPGTWQKYTGPDPHTNHTHGNFGYLVGRNGYGNVPKIQYRPAPAAAPVEGTVDTFQAPTSCQVYLDRLTPGVVDSASVYWIQRWLNNVPMPKAPLLELDGDYDADVETAVRIFQADVCGDPADGDLGPLQTQLLYDTARKENPEAAGRGVFDQS